MASSRCILVVFDSYQRAKINFLQNIYDFTVKKEPSVEQLLDLNIMQQITPLLTDVPNVQNLALVTTVKLCAASEVIAKHILKKKVLERLDDEFECQPKEYRRNVLQIVKNISKYSDLTSELLTQAKHLLTTSIHDLDTLQRELVLAALTNISNHGLCNAQRVMDLEVLPQMILCLQVPVTLSLESTQLIRALSKQSVDISGVMLDNNVLTYLADNLHNPDIKLMKATMLCLAEIAKHSLDFAEKVMSTRVLCKTILYTSHCDNSVKRSATVLLRELSKHSADLSRKIVQHGALAGLISIIANTSGLVRLPAVMTLGYMGAQSDHLALAIIQSQGLHELITALNNETSEATLGAIIWTIEQLTKHSAQHVNYLNDTNVFAKLLRIYISADSCPEMKSRCLATLLSTVNKCLNIQDIDLLLYESPPEILLPALKQLCKIFPVDLKARRVFVSAGGLKRVQALKPPAGSELCEAVTMINSYFPEDIVRYYSPRCTDHLLAKVDQFTPQVSLPLITCAPDTPSDMSLGDEEGNWSSPISHVISS
ncbi:hypothetical protein M8J77_009284 [Diaphorina citri]|nr:hypothetical protein M8J77_009284 [Diaphorina citri]